MAAMDRVLQYSVYIEDAEEMKENNKRINSAAMAELPVFDRSITTPNKAEPAGEYKNKVAALTGELGRNTSVMVHGRRTVAIFDFERLVCDNDPQSETENDLYADEKLLMRATIEEIEEEDETAGTYSLHKHEKLSRPIKCSLNKKYSTVASELKNIMEKKQEMEKGKGNEDKPPSMLNYLFGRE